MKKKLFLRCLLGASVGLTIGTLITLTISFLKGTGEYFAVVPELITDCGSETNAMLVQTLLSFVYGAAFAGASLIWEREDWSLLKQTLLHLAICSLATLPVAYACRWMQHSVRGVLIYFGFFFAAYAVVWVVLYLTSLRRVKRMNERIAARRAED